MVYLECFLNNYLVIGWTRSRVAIFIGRTSSELLVTGTSFWMLKEVFTIWCWTWMRELSGTCPAVVLKLNIFVLTLVAWFYCVIASTCTLQSILVRWRVFWKSFYVINTLQKFQGRFLWAFNFNYVWKKFVAK